MFKLNNPDQFESLKPIRLTKKQFPIAFENKVQELIEECNMSRKDAEKFVEGMEINLEIYYEKGAGLFAVESEAVECGTIFSPYTKDEGEKADED